MNQATASQILEHLCEIRKELDALRKGQTKLANQQTRTNRILKEVQKAMAITQADIDAVSQQVDDIKTAVTSQGVEIAKIGADITAFLNQPNLTLDAVKAKLTEVGGLVTSAGQALQNVDDLVPEQPAP